MNEFEKYLPTPPQMGPPLPSILQAYWPWVRVPPLPIESPSYVDVNDGVLKASMEKHRAEQKAKGLVPFYYE